MDAKIQFYEEYKDKIRCRVCPHNCILDEGKFGICRVRTLKSNEHCHVEITTLLVSDENDSLEEAREIAKFIASVNENIPLHLSRYFPRYKMENVATKTKKIAQAQNEAKKYFKHVYVGNAEGVDNNTYCPKCNKLLIRRNGYNTEVLMKENKCEKCGQNINIII